MNRWTIFLAVIVMGTFTAIGCSGGNGSPLVPGNGQDSDALPLSGGQDDVKHSQTHLWGYYDIYFDFVNQTVEAVVDRTAMFTLNVVDFVNTPVYNLEFYIHGIQVGTGYIDVDIDVSIRHPFPGLNEFNGYDVRGVFIGQGSASMDYNSDLVYPVYGDDQAMYDYDGTVSDPHDGLVGMPDGYTRWYNAKEFPGDGIFGYSEGVLATPGYTGHLTATLNPYKYFADGLDVEDDLLDFLNTTNNNGVFSAGETNTRNYYLRFPTPEPNVAFGYAILANWESIDVHPANASEAVACVVTVTDDIWYEDSINNGGDLILDIDIFDWDSAVNPAGVMEDYSIIIESNVLSAIYAFDTAEMTPVDGGVNYSTYHVEISADDVTFNSNTADGEVWVIVEDSSLDYTNDFGIENLADTDSLAAFFRESFHIDDEPVNGPPDITSGVDGDDTPYYLGVEQYSVTAVDDEDDPISYDWTVTDVATSNEVTDGVVDNLDGTIDIDFAVIGASIGDEYLIECDVTDNINAPVAATPLDVTASLADIIVVDDPNISIGSGVPGEIAVDPGSDRTAVGFDGNLIRVFTNDYTSTTTISFPYFRPFDHFDYNDTYGVRDHSTPSNGYGYITWSSEEFTSMWGGISHYDWCNKLGTTQMYALFWRSTDSGQLIRSSSYHHFDLTSLNDAAWWGGTGTSGIVGENVVALDVPINASGLYILETLPATNTAVVERHTFAWNNASYGGLSFGEGTLDDPLDLTVDSNDYIYILDVNTTDDPVIYCYDNTGLPIATSGTISSGDISGTPLRIDAAVNPNPDEVHVLHSNGVTKFTIDW